MNNSNTSNLNATLDVTAVRAWVNGRQDQIITGSAGAYRVDLSKLIDFSRTFTTPDEAVNYLVSSLTGQATKYQAA